MFAFNRSVALTLIAGGLLAALTGCPRLFPPLQPAQPTTGPGSSAASFASFTTQTFLSGAEQYFLYQPASPTPASAPVVIFLHGYGGVNARAYGGWIEHLLDQGYIVIYPVYQLSAANGQEYTDNAMASIRDAFDRLGKSGNVAAETNQVAVVGHSLGGAIAMNYAARAASAGLPVPRVIMLANAGDANVLVPTLPSIQEGNYDSIAPDTLFLAVTGASDRIAGRSFAQTAFNSLSQIAVANRQVIEYRDDDYGDPPIETGHFAPLSLDERFDNGLALIPGAESGSNQLSEADVVDYNGYWKNFDGLMDAAFLGTNRDFALGATTEQLSLGDWTNGVPITPAVVLLP